MYKWQYKSPVHLLFISRYEPISGFYTQAEIDERKFWLGACQLAARDLRELEIINTCVGGKSQISTCIYWYIWYILLINFWKTNPEKMLIKDDGSICLRCFMNEFCFCSTSIIQHAFCGCFLYFIESSQHHAPNPLYNNIYHRKQKLRNPFNSCKR